MIREREKDIIGNSLYSEVEQSNFQQRTTYYIISVLSFQFSKQQNATVESNKLVSDENAISLLNVSFRWITEKLECHIENTSHKENDISYFKVILLSKYQMLFSKI